MVLGGTATFAAANGRCGYNYNDDYCVHAPYAHPTALQWCCELLMLCAVKAIVYTMLPVRMNVAGAQFYRLRQSCEHFQRHYVVLWRRALYQLLLFRGGTAPLPPRINTPDYVRKRHSCHILQYISIGMSYIRPRYSGGVQSRCIV
jgi:hypothetical protein